MGYHGDIIGWGWLLVKIWKNEGSWVQAKQFTHRNESVVAVACRSHCCFNGNVRAHPKSYNKKPLIAVDEVDGDHFLHYPYQYVSENPPCTQRFLCWSHVSQLKNPPCSQLRHPGNLPVCHPKLPISRWFTHHVHHAIFNGKLLPEEINQSKNPMFFGW